ncbi:TlpA family protein disulfide reductase [Chryseobacterium viscerum]|uniref:Thioredoxin domain-containing protein n=1 Tax=Chryseobacterium viscerum TaxID=1037377 RepID=A0A316W9G3_9FLAO|nr:thioredoxin-like domain-containing protein [Chryseobacterium viscerum]PWN57944.1 hypothetical protein C1634_025160 [Chryseobacterium viscerum]
MNKILYLLLFISSYSFSQKIEGRFKNLKNNEIVLSGYDGTKEKELVKATTDNDGRFMLNYPPNYIGAAMLQTKGIGSVIVLLNHENFTMQWENPQDFNTLTFTGSPENNAFAQGISINQETEQKLTGLKYLRPLYKNQTEKLKWLEDEIKIQDLVFENYFHSLSNQCYAGEYLKLRKLLVDMHLTQTRYKELSRVKEHEETFEKIDFTNVALWYSGLLKEILTDYYQLLENYKDEKIITEHCIESNNVWLKSLEKEASKLQEIAEFCFTMLEKKNLTKASEHIALAILNKKNCQLTDKQSNLFEQYRNLALGKIAPNINLKNKSTLKDLKNKYKLVVFGASWCPNCQNDYPSLSGKYKKLKETHDLETIYVSIDTEKVAFENYYKEAPFKMYFDGKGWDTQAAKDYHVFATPTYFLLDKEMKIIAKPKNPEELEGWLMNIN